MLSYPIIDPVALSVGPFSLGDTVLGPLQVHWYGIMYLLGFALAWMLAVEMDDCVSTAPARADRGRTL